MRLINRYLQLPCMVLILAGSALLAQSASAEMRVVATTPSLGMLANAIGGDQVSVRVLAPADRDVHYLDARPSYMATMRRADLLLSVGAGLEEGWLPAALSGSANPGINQGRPGHFRAADFLRLRESITLDGPNMGHVHAEGNPHFTLDPRRMATLAVALAERMGQLQPTQATYFADQATRLAARLHSEADNLAASVTAGQRYVSYHEDLDYLSEWLPVEVVGYLEPVPGIPPTARHLRELTDSLAGTEGRVLFAVFQPERGGRYLQEQLGWSVHPLPLEPAEPTLDSYLSLLAQWTRVFIDD
ncbi:metal ABC transporter substrate-binding protein [Halopseudomonas salegens]|uniref:Zinc/manganese transport system substrate-binding protein n=1 Tax=Halopseudomonas salegens TaxID=1434072 RepID=A0A1H2FGI0_9GAMM|nr:metal ABC transporter substrate-binding protein [Halopseudomonas salegens]SDU06048.1 zinc/manganese transport system substrate-binding protein [Halopseudomonas salegens]